MKKIILYLTLYLSLNINLSANQVILSPQNGLSFCTSINSSYLNTMVNSAGNYVDIIGKHVYDRLFSYSPLNGEVIPSLAKSYKVLNNGTKFIINLHKGIQFHQQPYFTPTRDLQSSDVIFSFNRILSSIDIASLTPPDDLIEPSIQDIDNSTQNKDPNNNIIKSLIPLLAQEKKADIRKFKTKQYEYYINNIAQNYSPYFDSIDLKSQIKHIYPNGKYQIIIELKQPNFKFISYLASQYANIFSQEYAAKLERENNMILFEQNPIGTGAFMVKDKFSNQYIRLIKNHNYWQEHAKTEQIIIDISGNRSSRLAKFLNNECDILSLRENNHLDLLSKNYQIYNVSGMNFFYLGFNLQKKSMQDLVVRKAIARAINKERIINDIYHQNAILARGVITPSSWNLLNPKNESNFNQYFQNNIENIEKYDPKKAEQSLLAKKLTLKLWVINEEQIFNPNPIKTALMIKNDLQKVGVTVDIIPTTRKHLLQELQGVKADYDMILSGWVSDNLEPDSYLRPMFSCKSQTKTTNNTNWCNPKFDQILNKASQTPNKSAQYNYYIELENILAELLPIVPIAHVSHTYVTHNVKGIDLNSINGIDFKHIIRTQHQQTTKQGGLHE